MQKNIKYKGFTALNKYLLMKIITPPPKKNKKNLTNTKKSCHLKKGIGAAVVNIYIVLDYVENIHQLI